MNTNSVKICVIGLGYVGLPLAVEFSENFQLLVLISIQIVSKN